MPKALRLRLAIVLAVMAMGAIYLVPTLAGERLPPWWGKLFPTQRIRLGLDLKGGIHLVLGVQVDKAVENATERVALELADVFRSKRIRTGSVEREGLSGIRISLSADTPREKVLELLGDYPNYEILSQSSEEISLGMLAEELDRIRRYAVDQGRETIANRIDQFGVAETTVVKQGRDRILVELPGVSDPKRAIDLIGKTALLEFKLLDERGDLQRAIDGNPPPGRELLYGVETKEAYLVESRVLLTGDYITDGKVEIGGQFNEPSVSITFDRRGARLFSLITEENLKRRLAIILDGNIYSAPVIQDKISGGRAQITGRFTMEEARDLAIVLRAGSLPAPVEILENRTVGPSLGADLIRKGILATAIGSLLVVLFMAVYYRLSGLVANLALLINLFLLLAVLAGLQAALTLPGIAGIVLTMGIAVDANVLIFERVREELRQGRPVRGAIETGYARAFTTILDANVTTVLTAVVLWFAGTGPIKGFAVTLTIGIVISMFTAIIVTRLIFDYVTYTRRVTSLSI